MTEEQVRTRLAQNLTHYRKLMGLTQTELSEKINYSDKSVSKWERGEGVPDIFVLTQLADLFGVSLNDLFAAQPKRHLGNGRQRLLIAMMSVGLVWFCATLAFFVCKLVIPQTTYLWMAYVVAIPVSAIVLIVFTSLWWSLTAQCCSVSLLIWGLAMTLHLPLQVDNLALVYVLAGVFQVLVVLWYAQRYVKKHANKDLFHMRKEKIKNVVHSIRGKKAKAKEQPKEPSVDAESPS